jgi:hypothetical protein
MSSRQKSTLGRVLRFATVSDFSTQAEAQAVHDACFAQVGFEVHNLDQDNDGIACESLPPLWRVLD